MRISDWSSDVCSSDLFHRNRGRFAAADAQAGDAARLAVALERGDQRRDDARAAGADRVAERGRAAMDVDLVVRAAEVVHREHRDTGKGERQSTRLNYSH